MLYLHRQKAFWCIKASLCVQERKQEAEPSALITIFNARVSFPFQGISLTLGSLLLSDKLSLIYMMLKTNKICINEHDCLFYCQTTDSGH